MAVGRPGGFPNPLFANYSAYVYTQCRVAENGAGSLRHYYFFPLIHHNNDTVG